MATVSAPRPARAVTEGWILAGTLDGRPCFPAPGEDVAGLPHLARFVGELVMSGVYRVVVVSDLPIAPDLIESLAADPRFAKASVTVNEQPPGGAAGDGVVVLRGDRVFHRELPKLAIGAWTQSSARVAMIEGASHDGVFVTDRASATVLVHGAGEPGALTAALRALTEDELALAPEPYLAFTAVPADRAALRRAERQLVWSLRKSADGLASKLVNRHLSLRLTWLLLRTRVIPNHVTLTALACAIAGAIVIGQGGYLAGAIGMLLVNLGSIIDGVDGELARLKFLFSRTGQWLDTVVDDLGNVCYSAGIMVNLTAAGVTWAAPLWLAATACFVLTQSSQYWLIARVYHSGDLAAIPWAFQSSEFLSQRPKGLWPWLTSTAPKLLKRDAALTIFVGLALAGQLDWILVAYSAGAIVFFAVFSVQLARNAGAVRRALRERH